MVVVKRNAFGASIQVPEEALSGFHFSNVAGGVKATLPRKTLCAYMSCDAIPEGAYFEHSCMHGEGPHSIKVLIPKGANASMYARLVKAAQSGEQS